MFSLVLPTYNEAANIERCITAVSAVLKGTEFEIIVADDDSPDKTWEVAGALHNPHVRVLRRTENPGLSAAVVEAFDIAKGDTLGVMDADLQHDECILPELLEALQTNEFAIGSRAVPDGSYGSFSTPRLCISKTAAMMARLYLGVPIRDPMAGYFVLRKDLYERVRPYVSPKGYKIMLELFYLAQPSSFVEIGYTFRDRVAGESKLNSRVMLAYLASLSELRARAKNIPSRKSR